MTICRLRGRRPSQFYYHIINVIEGKEMDGCLGNQQALAVFEQQVQILQMDLQASTTSIMITLDEYNELKEKINVLSLQKEEDAKTISKLTSKYDRLLSDSTKRLQEIGKLRLNARELSIRALRSMNGALKKEERMQKDLEKRDEEIIQAFRKIEKQRAKCQEAEAETIKINSELESQKADLDTALQEKEKLNLITQRLQQQLKEREAVISQLQTKLANARIHDQDAFDEMVAQLRSKEAEYNSLKEEVNRLERDNANIKQNINDLSGKSKILEREKEELRKTYQNIKEEIKQRMDAVVDYYSQEHQISSSSIQDQSSMLFRTEPNRENNNQFSDIFGKFQYSISSIHSNRNQIIKTLRADKEKLQAECKQVEEKCKQLNDQLTHLKTQLAHKQSLVTQNKETIKALEEEKEVFIRQIKQSKTRIEQLNKEIEQIHSLPHVELKTKGSDRDTKNQSSASWNASSGISQWDPIEISCIMAQKNSLQASLISQQQKWQILDKENRQLRQKYENCKFQYHRYKDMGNKLKEKYQKVKAQLKQYTEHSNS